MAKRIKIKVRPHHNVSNQTNKESILDLGGTLIQMETHSLQFRKGLSKAEMERMSAKQRNEWVRSTKSTLDRKHLHEINNIITAARDYVDDVSLPFPLKGVKVLPYPSIDKAKDRLSKFILDLRIAVNAFNTNYQEYIDEAEKILSADDIFNPNDYPREILHRFSISYILFDLTIPSQIGDKVRQAEIEKHRNLMKQTRDMGILALREGFADIIGKLTETLSGKIDGEKKRLHQVSIDKVESFFNSFQSKNLFSDDELGKLVKDAKNLMEGISSKDLHNDNDLATEINSQLKNVKGSIDKMVVNYKRKITAY